MNTGKIETYVVIGDNANGAFSTSILEKYGASDRSRFGWLHRKQTQEQRTESEYECHVTVKYRSSTRYNV